MPDAGEDVVQRAFVGRGKPYAIGRHTRHVEGGGQIDERLELGLLLAEQMPLQLDEHIVVTKQPDQLIEQSPDAQLKTEQQVPSRKRDQSTRAPLELVEHERPFAFRGAQLHAGDHSTEILVALLRLNKKRGGSSGRTLRISRDWPQSSLLRQRWV